MPLPGIAGIIRSVSQAGPVVSISPDSVNDTHYGAPAYAERAFTAMSSIGVPTSYLWSIASGTGSIISGGTTATATIRTTGACTIRCAIVIGGVTYSPEAAMLYQPGTLGGGGGVIPPPRGGGGELY